MRNENDSLPESGVCPRRSKCYSFFSHIGELHDDLELAFQNLYCRKDYSKCARFFLMDHQVEDEIPLDLLPNQEMRAHSLVKEGQRRYS